MALEVADERAMARATSVACYLPPKGPWLTAIKPKWTHASSLLEGTY